MRLDHCKLRKEIIKDLEDKMEKRIEERLDHLLANIKGIQNTMLVTLDKKHGEIEETAEKYIKIIKK